MVNLRDLLVGNRVKIVDSWRGIDGYNSEGKMDHWLGQTMTVRVIGEDDCRMEEDVGEYYGGWYWSGAMIDCVVDDSTPEYSVGNLTELLM